MNQLSDREIKCLKIKQWYELLKKKNDIYDIHFDFPEREYIREGKLLLISTNIIDEPEMEVTLLLLDNVLIITYEKNNNYFIYGKPIPISLSTLTYSDQKCSIKSNSKDYSESINENDDNDIMGYTFTVKHLSVESFTLFTSIQSEQKAWIEAIEKQSEIVPKPIAKENIFFSHKKLDSTVKTIHCLENDSLLLANDIGIFYLFRKVMMKPLLQLSKITQIVSLDEYDILFVLSNRKTYAFSIDLLLKGVYTNPNYLKQNKKINSNTSFITTGFYDNKPILYCVENSSYKTVVKMFEPNKALADLNYRKANQKLYIVGDVVSPFKQFSIPSESMYTRFFHHSLCVPFTKSSESSEIYRIKNLTTQSILDPNDVIFKNILKLEYSPMNVFKTQQNDFLLCDNKIGFFIDKNGNRSRPNILFKWNIIPRTFAYRAPYIYVFTDECISIWHEYDTVCQKQVILGNSICLLFDNDNDNFIYSKIENGKQRLAIIELLNI